MFCLQVSAVKEKEASKDTFEVKPFSREVNGNFENIKFEKDKEGKILKLI